MRTNQLSLKEKLRDQEVKRRLYKLILYSAIAFLLLLFAIWFSLMSIASIRSFEAYRTEYEDQIKARENNVTLWQDCSCMEQKVAGSSNQEASVCLGCKKRVLNEIKFRSEDDAYERTVNAMLDAYTICDYALTGVCVQSMRNVLRVVLYSQRNFLSVLIVSSSLGAVACFVFLFVRPRFVKFTDVMNKGDEDEAFEALMKPRAAARPAKPAQALFPNVPSDTTDDFPGLPFEVTDAMAQAAAHYQSTEQLYTTTTTTTTTNNNNNPIRESVAGIRRRPVV
jgi:hypothetical protein